MVFLGKTTLITEVYKNKNMKSGFKMKGMSFGNSPLRKDKYAKEIITDEKGRPTVKNLTTGKTIVLKETDVVYNERTGKSRLKRSYRRKN